MYGAVAIVPVTPEGAEKIKLRAPAGTVPAVVAAIVVTCSCPVSANTSIGITQRRRISFFIGFRLLEIERSSEALGLEIVRLLRDVPARRLPAGT
jgi:hypothetical protein